MLLRVITLKLITLLFLVNGCASSVIPVGSEAQKLSRANIKFSVEGVGYQGTALVQRKTSQKISVTVPDKAVKLVFTTCHREDVFDNPSSSWSILFQPSTLLENWGSCIVTISVITQKGNMQQGIIDFTSNETEPATSYCNGKVEKMPGGATFCQARVGLYQRISFGRLDMEAEPATGCPEMKKDGYDFQYEMAPGLCIYAFRSRDGKATHRLTSRGYAQLEAE
jgi:hypothetical protein